MHSTILAHDTVVKRSFFMHALVLLKSLVELSYGSSSSQGVKSILDYARDSASSKRRYSFNGLRNDRGTKRQGHGTASR